MSDILVVTTEQVPNFDIIETYGEVFGQTTRSRNMFSSFGQAFKSATIGGEIKGYTKLQNSARDEAIERMRIAAAERGANAVVMFRFDSNSGAIGDSVNAYGTAVKIAPRA
ncbi:heavy metal-binding domain-containing protein [Weissella tructae]|uniref:UPF0145 protein WS74_1018 n=2 Tax=Weissella TaxID=46255 RepID=A0A075U077_9LACO|nr:MULTISPECIES: heavy metal-binding domain-containing protein [Weissella]AIG65891.1 hypothetical protein WS08_0952 [Weissella tructae]AIM63270.1 hypothetical protein WS74_1018 [Weissella ceti]AIM64604.1 hypothetical protein WS105_1014 [Weissella ceti]ELA07262.1 hypothetical protein WCNC_02357 [Weissella ceti NC36]QVV91050.1 heavy metal-binding domain-containing protein [Weissella tructae]